MKSQDFCLHFRLVVCGRAWFWEREFPETEQVPKRTRQGRNSGLPPALAEVTEKFVLSERWL